MVEYEKMYYQLFNAVTNAVHILQEAQRQMEENFIESMEDRVILPEKANEAQKKIIG